MREPAPSPPAADSARRQQQAAHRPHSRHGLVPPPGPPGPGGPQAGPATITERDQQGKIPVQALAPNAEYALALRLQACLDAERRMPCSERRTSESLEGQLAGNAASGGADSRPAPDHCQPPGHQARVAGSGCVPRGFVIRFSGTDDAHHSWLAVPWARWSSYTLTL